MLIIRDLGFSNLVLVLSLVFPAIFFLLIRRKWRQSAARKEEIKRLMLLASEEAARAELEYSLIHRAELEYSLNDTTAASPTSPPPSYQCAVCNNPSTGRCALCKAARYCSGKCQIAHWRQGHKEECHPPAEETVISQKAVNQSTRFHGASKRSNLVERSSYESPFLNSSATELHAKHDSVKVEFDAINDSESSNASFSGFSSSPDSSESSSSSDDNSLCESSNSAKSGKNNSESPHVAHEIFLEDCDVEIPQRPKPGYSKSSGSVDSLNGSTNLSKSKTSDSAYNAGQVEFRSITASRRDDKVTSTGSSNKKSPSPSGFRESAHGSSAPCNLVDVPSPCSTPVPSGSYKTDLSNGESSPSFSFSSSKKSMTTSSQDAVKEVYDVLQPRRPQGGPALVDLNKDTVPSVKRESFTNRASISKPVVGSLSHVSSQANGSSEISTKSVGSYQTSTSSSSSYRRPGHALDDVDNNKLLKERPTFSTCASDNHASGKDEVRSTSHMRSGKADKSNMLGETAFQFASPSSIPRNGLKTSMWRAIDQLKGSVLSKHSQGGDSNATDGKCKEKGLISYEFFVQLHTSKGVELHPCGLLNCGNSCYANAVLQCLAFTPPLTSYFLQRLHSKTCIRRGWCFTCELENLILRMREGKSPVSPIGIVSQLKSIGSQLANGRQEDAHEFLRYAIDKMQSVCIMESGKKTITAADEERTVIGQTFGGYFRSKIQCSRCHGKSERHERMMDLTVEIEGDIGTLEEALRQFTRTETLDGENKYRCSRCKSYEKAKKKLTVLQAPNILTIALKRFQAGKFGKLNKPVQFPETLDLSSFMSGTTDKPKYSLYGVIVHVDVMNAAFSGHYICYVKDTWGKWFKIDDSTVTPVELKRVLNKEAYMLFYARDLSRDSRSVVKSRLGVPDPENTAAQLRSRDKSGSRVQSSNCYRSLGVSRSHPELDRIREDMSSSSSYDNLSLFSSSTSDEGSSSSTASTRDSFTSFDDLSDYIFGHNLPESTGWGTVESESRR